MLHAHRNEESGFFPDRTRTSADTVATGRDSQSRDRLTDIVTVENSTSGEAADGNSTAKARAGSLAGRTLTVEITKWRAHSLTGAAHHCARTDMASGH